MEEDLKNKNEKEIRINKEIKKIKKVYKINLKEKNNKFNDLVYRAAFLLVMAQDMESELLNCGSYTTTTVNGSQSFVKSHPLCKDYRDTIKSYQAIIKQLNEFVKEEIPVEPVKDELDEFLDS